MSMCMSILHSLGYCSFVACLEIGYCDFFNSFKDVFVLYVHCIFIWILKSGCQLLPKKSTKILIEIQLGRKDILTLNLPSHK